MTLDRSTDGDVVVLTWNDGENRYRSDSVAAWHDALDAVVQAETDEALALAGKDVGGRHLARTEARNFGTTGSLLQTLVDFGLDALDRQADGHAALKSGGAFNRNLHGYSSLHRHRPAFRPRIERQAFY